MMLTRWNPFQDLVSLHQDVNRLFGNMTEFFPPVATTNGNEALTLSLPLDVTQTEQGYEVKATVAGFTPESVEVSYANGLLTISAKHEREHEETKGSVVRRERVSGNLYRQISLPGEVNADKIAAKIENGILTVQVPKAARPAPIKIQIASEQQPAPQQPLVGAPA